MSRRSSKRIARNTASAVTESTMKDLERYCASIGRLLADSGRPRQAIKAATRDLLPTSIRPGSMEHMRMESAMVTAYIRRVADRIISVDPADSK